MRHAHTAGSRAAVRALIPAMSESRLAGLWRKLIHDLIDPYRPELHYMRGPGPKWYAKHGIPETR